MPDPILVGRSEAKLKELCAKTGGEKVHHRLGSGARRSRLLRLLRRADHGTPRRRRAQGRRRGQADLLREADRRRFEDGRRALRALPNKAGVKNGVVQDKLWLPGLLKLKRLDGRRASSARFSPCAASSVTGSSRATEQSRPSARPGTTARKTAAASSSTCSATGATCSTIFSAR